MKIPTFLHINGFDWEVVWQPDLVSANSCNGCCHADLQRLFLDPACLRQVQERAFIHELLHIIWSYSGLTQRYQDSHPTLEEEVVAALSVGLYQILNDNKLLRDR